MSESLDEFVARYATVKTLKKNLQANLDALTELTPEEKDTLMRLNLIMIRQCLQDFGAV